MYYTFFILVPRVLTHCAEFIETAGMIDGIYRLSGIASNIQKLRVAFDEDRVPNLYQDKGVIQVRRIRLRLSLEKYKVQTGFYLSPLPYFEQLLHHLY